MATAGRARGVEPAHGAAPPVSHWRHSPEPTEHGMVRPKRLAPMAEQNPDAVTLNTLHEDLRGGFAAMRTGFGDLKVEIADLKGEITDLKGGTRTGFADLKATLVAGFRSLPGWESAEEMIRLLREGNRLQEERFTQLDLRIREQHLEIQQVLHAVVEGQRVLVDEVRGLAGEIRGLSGEIRGLSVDIKALIARLDALIKGRGDGGPTT